MIQDRVSVTVGAAGLLACGAAETMMNDPSCWSSDTAHAVKRMVSKLLTEDLENLADVVHDSEQPHWQAVYDAAKAEVERRRSDDAER